MSLNSHKLTAIAFIVCFGCNSVCWSDETDATDDTSVPAVRTKKEKFVLEPDLDAMPQYFAPRKMQMRFGMQFQSQDNYCTKLFATLPFPMNWSEQTVTLVSSDLPNNATYDSRHLPAGAQQILLSVPALAANQQLDVTLTVEVEKSFVKPPKNPSILVYPKKTIKDKELQWYLGDSPYIETRNNQIRDIAREIKEKNPENAWAHVELIYDWVRDNIAYRNGTIRTTKEALKDKSGDCEEMTGIFVAICRATNIPARCVWIPEHCYPEFYLEDPNGFGHWYPCQVAGERQFGQMFDYRPILQKGDRFKVPEQKGVQRYVAETFTCKQRILGPRAPSIVPIRDLGELTVELETLKASTEPKAADAMQGNTDALTKESEDKSSNKDLTSESTEKKMQEKIPSDKESQSDESNSNEPFVSDDEMAVKESTKEKKDELGKKDFGTPKIIGR